MSRRADPVVAAAPVTRTTHSQPPPAPDTTPTDPIDELRAQTGEATQSELTLLVGDVDHALTEAGRTVATPRLTDDVVRVGTVAHGFFTTAPAVLREKVKLAPDVLRVLVWAASEGHRAWRTQQTARAARRQTRATKGYAAAPTFEKARQERDQLAESLRGVAAGNDATLQRIAAALAPSASGHVETGPGQSLRSLVDIGRAFVASGEAPVRARCKLFGLTGAWLDACARVAEDALAAERAQTAPVAKEDDAQYVVDRWDGAGLLLIERVVRAFAEGNKRDPAVPKLQYVSLRGVLGRHPRAHKGVKRGG